jgi:hypothetical protein
MMAWRPQRLGVWLALCALGAALCLGGCELNPQPEVPEDDPSEDLGHDGGLGASADAGWSTPPPDDKRAQTDDPGEYESVDTDTVPPSGFGASPGRPDAGADDDAGQGNKDEMTRDAGLVEPGAVVY